MTDYDIVIIGAGGGGITAAFEAQRRGAKVALLEKHKIGGECTHSGCVPSKALIDVAKHYHAMQNSHLHGLGKIDAGAAFDFRTAMEHVNSIIDGIYAHEQPERFNNLGIDTFISDTGGSFIDSNTVSIGGQSITGENIIISTGSAPRPLPTEGDNPVEFLTNENFWGLREQPESVAFLGGGVISAELGQALARFGTRVTIIDRGPRVLSVVDDEIADYLISIFDDMGIEMITHADASVCSTDSDGKVCLQIESGEQSSTLKVDKLFVAIGRVPNLTGLNLDNAGVEYTRHGVIVNDKMQTSSESIYAVGDVASRSKFSHVANYQSEIVVRNILGDGSRVIDINPLPWAIFTDPEVGHVGLTEDQARQQYKGVQTFKVDAATDRFITDTKTGGFLKIVMDADNRIIGASGVGAYAGEWVQFFTLAIKQQLRAEDIADTIFSYPTYAEVAKKACSRFLRTRL
ncbi:MAG: NAD(P)/FAD-dependent oxidoreductase [Pseudomonadota bacterium]